MLIEVKQGDSDVPEECHHLGQVELTFPRPMPRETAFDVTLTMNQEAILEVAGVQHDTGAVVKAVVERPATMSKDRQLEAAKLQPSYLERMRD